MPTIRHLYSCLSLTAAAMAFFLFSLIAFTSLSAEITVQSYHLRDRAIVLDSLVLRKQMIFQFESSLPLKRLRGAAAAAELSHDGKVIARDTTWIVDEPGGNLGFGLPFDLPEGMYHLALKLLSPTSGTLDSFEGDYDRADLKLFYNREVNFWDYTAPYAHLECSGYGQISWSFEAKQALEPENLELSARLATDNDHPGRVRVELNGVLLGIYDLPAGESDKLPQVISFQWESQSESPRAALKAGRNELSLSVLREDNQQGMGLRVFGRKNSGEAGIEPGVPIILKVSGRNGVAQTFEIPVWGEEGEHVKSAFTQPFPMVFTRRQEMRDGSPLPLGPSDIARGYVLFQRHWLRHVYPWTVPADSERVDSLALTMARNDFEPLTLAIHPLRDLGRVRLELGELVGPGGAVIPRSTARIHVARNLKIRTGGTSYELVPRLLARMDTVCVPVDHTTRFWITLRTPADLPAGEYRGMVRVIPEHERPAELPLKLRVLPVSLEEVPEIEYSMFMSYEFFELESKDLSAADKEKVYRDGVATFRDYLDHGLNTVDVSSPYYFQWNRDGSPRLEHLKGIIRGAREAGFTRPVYWYFAHYVQAAKGQHPGNIRLYDPKIHPARAKMLVQTALELNRELGGLPLRFVPIDEPRIELRQRITLELCRAIKQVPGTVIQSSTDIGGKLLDIENNSSIHRKRLGPGEFVRKSKRKVWEYHNEAISGENPGYSRYIYGLYTWRQDLDGMNSWGPATTENSRGNPFEDLDHENPDYMLFYPAPGGPWPSVNWEALREGIEDVRYLHQLEKAIRERKDAKPQDAALAGKWLDDLRGQCDFDESGMAADFGPWTPERFDSVRAEAAEWIIRLRKQ